MEDSTAALGAAATALLSLDSTLVGQFLLGRPLVVAAVLGALTGEPALAAAAGLICELLTLERLPVGSEVPPNGAIACGGAILWSAGGGAPAALAVPAGLLAGWGYRQVEIFLRRKRASLAGICEERVRGGVDPGLGPAVGASCAVEAAAAFLFLGAATVAMRPGLSWLWSVLPRAPRLGLEIGLAAAPLLGAAVVARALWPRR